MRIELQAELFERYPLLFRQPGMRLTSDPGEEPYLENDEGPIDYYGIECGDGWLPIIEQLAELCEREIRSMRVRRIPRAVWPRCVQVKEKLGTLRFYVRGNLSEATRAAIDVAEEQSAQVCEICGKPAELRQDDAYVLTLCAGCADSRKTADPVTDWAAYDQHLSGIKALLETRPK